MIDTKFEFALAAGLITFFAGFIGVALILLNLRWSDRNLRWGVGFGAGLLIGLSFLEIIPTSMDLAGEDAMLYVLVGFISFFMIEKFIQVHRFEEIEAQRAFHFSRAIIVALCLHALLDGLVIGLGFHFDEVFGMIVFLAILFHKLPVSVSMASIFLGGAERRSAIIQMLVFSFATPVGIMLSLYILEGVPDQVIGLVVALSAGVFLYLGATDMLPDISHGERHGSHVQDEKAQNKNKWSIWEPTLWVFIGIAASLVPRLLILFGVDVHHH